MFAKIILVSFALILSSTAFGQSMSQMVAGSALTCVGQKYSLRIFQHESIDNPAIKWLMAEVLNNQERNHYSDPRAIIKSGRTGFITFEELARHTKGVINLKTDHNLYITINPSANTYSVQSVGSTLGNTFIEQLHPCKKSQ